jgi:peptide/nickel transport system permease protein
MADSAGALGNYASVARTRSFRRLTRNRGAMVGLSIYVLLLSVAILAPVIAPYDPFEISLRTASLPPSAGHLLGTDLYGRDVLSRVIFGARISLFMGVVANVASLVPGLILGLPAAYYGRTLDSLLMRLTDVLLALPSLLLAMAFVAILGTGLINAILAIGIARSGQYARLIRGSVLSAKENEYVHAAVSTGCSDMRIMLRHILPNILAPVIVYFTLGVGTATLFGASLSFIGLGAQPPSPEWGRMCADGRGYMRTAWWLSVFPGLAIMATVLAVNLFGDGLRSATDPKSTT